MTGRSEVAQMQPLERRRMLAANLDAHPDTTFVPNVVFPGATFSIPVEVGNHGTSATSQSFVVGARLVPVSVAHWFAGASFGGDGFVSIGSATRSAALAADAHATVTVNATVPSDITAGLYALVVKSDFNDSIDEDSESDNEGIALAVAVLSDGGAMVINGSAVADDIRMAQATLQNKAAVSFKTDQGALNFRIGAVTSFNISLLDGDDIFVVEGSFTGVTADGGGGNDRMVGGDGPETLIGGAGKDVLDGGFGNDRLNGNGGNDKLFGNAGADRLYGYAGNDYLDGGSSGDRLYGGAGLDSLFGQSGDDRLFSDDDEVDHLFGASGVDSALADPEDLLSSIESPLIVD